MAKGGFFNNYFYGKSGKKDFTEADLPQTRFQLFRTVFWVRKGSMVGLNFLYLLFWLPALFWTFLNLLQLGAVESLSLNNLVYSWLLVMAPLIALTGPFNFGVSDVLRRWARDEHAFVWMQFRAGVKANWKQGLIFGVINGVMPLLAFLSLSFYRQMISQSPVFYLPLAIILAVFAMWNLCALILPTMLVSYELRFVDALKNAMLMCVAELPRAVGILIATLIVPILFAAAFLFMSSALNWLAPVAILFYTIIGLSFNKLIAASFANMLCEKFMNTKIDGAGINIGLRSASENKIED